MLKKAIIILISQIVSVFLLAHAVLPHHHHGQMPCFSLTEHCCYEAEHSSNGHQCPQSHSDGCSHHHDGTQQEKEGDCCTLNQLVIATSGQEYEKTIGSGSDHSPSANLIQAILWAFTSFDIFLPESPESLRSKPYLTHYYPAFIGQSSALRAPPFHTV